MIKSLYDSNHRYTSDASLLSNETHEKTREVFRKFVDMGYSPREVAHLMQTVITDMELETVLSNFFVG